MIILNLFILIFFFKQLENYFNKKNIKFNKNSIKKQIVTSLGFKNCSRVYTNLKFTSTSILNISTHISFKDYNDLKNEINILKFNCNQSDFNYLVLLKAHKELLLNFKTLEMKYLEISKSIEVV